MDGHTLHAFVVLLLMHVLKADFWLHRIALRGSGGSCLVLAGIQGTHIPDLDAAVMTGSHEPQPASCDRHTTYSISMGALNLLDLLHRRVVIESDSTALVSSAHKRARGMSLDRINIFR